MKTLQFIYTLLAIFLFASCGNSTSENQYDEFENENFKNYENSRPNEFAQNEGGYQQNNAGENQQRQNNGGKKMHQLKDPSTNAVFGTMPIPTSWRAVQGDKELFFQGPGGIKVFNDFGGFFQYSNDQGYNQMLKQQGTQVKRPMNMEQTFTTIFLPQAQKEGARMTNKYPLPQLAARDRKNDARYIKTSPGRSNFEAMVIEFESNDGNKTVVIAKHQMVDYGQGLQGWGFTYSAMECSASVYEQAKQDFLYAMMNIEINQQHVQRMNQKTQQATQQQLAGHQQRMNNIKSFGEQNTRNFNARSAASDAQYNSWKSGQVSSDRMQTNTINSINEVSTYRDASGNNVQVEGYYNNVYSNGNGEYIGTDNYNYNPNSDTNVNGANWEQMNATGDGWN